MTTSNKPEKKTDNTYGDYWSGKKPYLVHDFRKMMQKKTQEEYYFHELNIDPMSELLRPYAADPDLEGIAWEYMAPPGIEWPGFDWPGGPLPVAGECQLACNPTMLDCRGGCNKIACICGAGPLTGVIKSDPTGGHMSIGGSTPTTVTVCVGSGAGDLGQDYATAVVEISDGSRTVAVEVALVDCIDCCEELTLSGAATVNPGATWTGTISPACPGISCQVTSNSGCTLSCNVNAAGSQVTVTPGASDCGSFTVTVTDDADPNCTATDSVGVRINNTGQGGSWVSIYACSSACPGFCSTSCTTGSDPVGTWIDADGYTWMWGTCTCCTQPPGTSCDNSDVMYFCWGVYEGFCPPVGWPNRIYWCCGWVEKYEWKCTC